MGPENTCEVCHRNQLSDFRLICNSCIGDHKYVGNVRLFDKPDAALIYPDGNMEFLESEPADSDIRVRVGPVGRKPIFEVRRREFYYFGRAKREVSTYLYDRAHRIFAKRYQDATTGGVEYDSIGDLENQDLHGESGKRRRNEAPP